MNYPEKIASTYHNEQLKTTGDHVLMAWGDGRVTSTKGGDLFGQRSLHELCGNIPGSEHFGWSKDFPVKSGDTSYAIVENEDQAHEIRGAIIDCVCDWFQSRKKLRY